MSSDIAVNISNRVPSGSPILNKPSYLITLDVGAKTKAPKYFITTEQPDLLNGFVKVRGIFVDCKVPEEQIITSFSALLTDAKKELFLELLLPWHKICSIRSLVFKAK